MANRPMRETCFHLLRFHLHDWLAIVLLICLEAALLAIHPFKRFVGEFGMDDLRYPFKSNTVPFAAVPVIAIGIPLVVFICYFLIRKDAHDLHHAILGLLFSVLITAVITDSVKNAVGRPRPDFFWRCFPDGKPHYTPDTRQVICTGNAADIREGHKSFPSGHTSWSFAGLGYLSLYLAGKITPFDRQGRVAKLVILIIPLLAATLVGISRVDDYWHHWQDVFAGAAIGMIVALFCYRQHFPSLYDELSMSPYPFRGYPPVVARAPEDWPPHQNGAGSHRAMEISISNL